MIVGDKVIASSGSRILSILDLGSGADAAVLDADLGSGARNSIASFTGSLVIWDAMLVVIDRSGALTTYRRGQALMVALLPSKKSQ